MPISEARHALLEVRGLHAGYGKVQVLHGIDVAIRGGERVALLGPNGAGKTTLLRALSGLLPCDGVVRFAGHDLEGGDPRRAAQAGLVHVIEGHRVFTQLSVADNLALAGYGLPRRERGTRIEEALAFFPELGEKHHDKAGLLSGGQQQMLAVAQGLVRRPRLLMLDEPSAGLSPLLVDRVLSVARRLGETGVAVLLVEQLIDKALGFASRVYAMARGRIVLSAPTGDPDLPRRIEHAYFGQDVSTPTHPAGAA